jgi:glycosyltransferase involved in cell wall biosynthesis
LEDDECCKSASFVEVMPMKILFVSAFASSDLSSYRQRLLNLKEGLQRCGVVADMLYLGDYFFRSPILIEALNIPIIRRELEGYDAVHGGQAASYVLGLVKKLQNFMLIHDVHGCIEEFHILKQGNFDLINNIRYLQGLILEEVSVRNSDFFVTCSKPLRDRLLHRGIDPSVVEVLRNGVDTELFKPKDVSSDGKGFVVTYAGAFQRWQGIENLVTAATLIKETDVKFRIIGFRKEDHVLKNKLERILAGRAELIDSLSQDELVDQLCLSDILIIPRSRHCATQMAFPTKFAEYIATGKPVIVTNVDETANFVRESNCGFVCEPSAESIAKTIIKVRRLPSRTLLNMGKNGRRLAESKFDIRIIAKQYYEFLRKVLPNS